MLVLFLIYLGYLALWAAVDDEQKAARLAAILCLVGLINLPIVHFSVDWWSSLHQPASVFRPGGSSIHPSMLAPLMTMAGAYASLFAALMLYGCAPRSIAGAWKRRSCVRRVWHECARLRRCRVSGTAPASSASRC